MWPAHELPSHVSPTPVSPAPVSPPSVLLPPVSLVSVSPEPVSPAPVSGAAMLPAPFSIGSIYIVKWRSGRNAKFNSADDPVLVRKLAAANGHVEGFGERRKGLESAAARANEKSRMHEKLTWKCVQGRYQRLQEIFCK